MLNNVISCFFVIKTKFHFEDNPCGPKNELKNRTFYTHNKRIRKQLKNLGINSVRLNNSYTLFTVSLKPLLSHMVDKIIKHGCKILFK